MPTWGESLRSLSLKVFVNIMLTLLYNIQLQAHGSDGMVEEDNCVFFLPHRPRGKICEPPMFLFMKGTGSVKMLQLYQLSLHLCSTVFFFVKFIYIHVSDSSCLTKILDKHRLVWCRSWSLRASDCSSIFVCFTGESCCGTLSLRPICLQFLSVI